MKDRYVISQKLSEGLMGKNQRTNRDEAEVEEDDDNKTELDAGREFIKRQSLASTVRNY